MNRAEKYINGCLFLMAVTRLLLPPRSKLPDIRDLMNKELGDMLRRGDITIEQYLDAMNAINRR